jgi:hypothetical protein
MRLELLSRGISEADVLQLIDGNSDPVAREVARIEWEYSTSVNRTHPLIDGLAAALGLSSGDVDALFIAAKAR